MNERIQKLNDYVTAMNDAGVRTNYLNQFGAESLAATKGEPAQIRRAKLIAHVLEVVDTPVLPHELIVGSISGLCPVWDGHLEPQAQLERAVEVMDGFVAKKRAGFDGTAKPVAGKAVSFEQHFASKPSRWALMSRVYHDASVTYDELQHLIAQMQERYCDGGEVEPFEVGRELERAFKISYPKEYTDLMGELPFFVGNHLSLNYGRICERGLGATKAQVEELLAAAGDAERREYYEAALITVDAVIAFVRRYAQACRDEAAVAEEPRAAELLEMAGVLDVVATESASGFREAVQLTWMLHAIASILGGSALSFGRLDQYLRPFYEMDMDNGAITREEAKELLECVWCKVNEPKMRTVQSLTLGGVTREGADATSDLTRLCLEVTADLARPYPNVGLRVHPDSPSWALECAMDAVLAGSGNPMILNDEVWVQQLQDLGYSLEDARDYYNMGCVEIMVPGKQPNWGPLESVALPAVLESTLHRIRDQRLEVSSYDELEALVFEDMQACVDADFEEAMGKKAVQEASCFDPYSSLLVDGCLESGRDMFRGGAACPTHWCVYGYGIGTCADSLVALKRHVFDEGAELTLAQVQEALDANFVGYEDVRRTLMDSPCYGNGIAEVDDIADRVLRRFDEMVFALNARVGEKDRFVTTLFGYFFHIYHGEIAGATPNGRLKGEPFSDSMGPSQGKDVKGPTRLLNSVLHLSQDYIAGGYALNFKVSPSVVNSPAGVAKTIALLRAYMRQGGPQIQMYTANADEMRDAKVHPEKHRDLIVRVGGYCEYFVNLDAKLQDEVIQRTMYE